MTFQRPLYWKMPDARGGRDQARSSIEMLVYSLDADRSHSQMTMFPKQPPKSTRRFIFGELEMEKPSSEDTRLIRGLGQGAGTELKPGILNESPQTLWKSLSPHPLPKYQKICNWKYKYKDRRLEDSTLGDPNGIRGISYDNDI